MQLEALVRVSNDSRLKKLVKTNSGQKCIRQKVFPITEKDLSKAKKNQRLKLKLLLRDLSAQTCLKQCCWCLLLVGENNAKKISFEF